MNAQAGEARSVETGGLDPKGDHAVTRSGMRPDDSGGDHAVPGGHAP